MDKDDIIKLAHEAGIPMSVKLNRNFETELTLTIEQFCFAALVTAAEREACAAMFDNRNVWDEEVGERIRARGNT